MSSPPGVMVGMEPFSIRGSQDETRRGTHTNRCLNHHAEMHGKPKWGRWHHSSRDRMQKRGVRSISLTLYKNQFKIRQWSSCKTWSSGSITGNQAKHLRLQARQGLSEVDPQRTEVTAWERRKLTRCCVQRTQWTEKREGFQNGRTSLSITLPAELISTTSKELHKFNTKATSRRPPPG